MNFDLAEIRKLSLAERLQLVDDIWESIAADTGALPAIPPEQLAELDRRHTASLADPSRAVPWQDVQAALKANLAPQR